jgi:hypothetical protein
MPRHGADPLCGDGGGGRFGHRRFLGPTGGPDFGFPNSLIAAKITGNLRNFRSFRRWPAPIRPAISIACEEFPVVCGSGESPSSFNSLRAIPCCSRNRELLRRNREFHKANRKFRARSHGRPRRLSSSADPIRRSPKIVLPKLLRPGRPIRLSSAGARTWSERRLRVLIGSVMRYLARMHRPPVRSVTLDDGKSCGRAQRVKCELSLLRRAGASRSGE